MLETGFTTLPTGHRLRYARAGQGPDLVLLHGYPDNLQIWSRLVPLIEPHFRVLAFDWPGMGRSEEAPGGATPQHQAERLAKILRSFGIGRTHVAGIDMGGQPALIFAASFPDAVESVVVMNCLAFGDEKTSWEIGLLRKFQFNRLALRRFPRLVFRRALRTFLPPGEQLPDYLKAELWDSFRQPAVRKFISKMCAGYQGHLPRLPALYSQIRCPALILWAEQDKHFPKEQAVRLNATIPQSKLVILPGAEHWMIWDRAPEVAREICDRLVGSRL